MRSLRLAIGFLTVLPVAPRDVTRMGPARTYFPLVGLALGAMLAALDFAARQALPSPVVGAILVVALLVLTRAIHTEGFMDACDGLFGGYSRSERLEILRDSHVGAFAVAGGISLLLLKWTLLTAASDEGRAGLLIVFPCLSRLGMLSTMHAFTYVREEGIGTAFQEGASRWQVVFGLAAATAAGGLLLGAAGLVLMGAAIGVSLALGKWISGMLGGMTGDTYGAVNEVAEVTALLLGVALVRLVPDLYQTPLW